MGIAEPAMALATAIGLAWVIGTLGERRRAVWERSDIDGWLLIDGRPLRMSDFGLDDSATIRELKLFYPGRVGFASTGEQKSIRLSWTLKGGEIHIDNFLQGDTDPDGGHPLITAIATGAGGADAGVRISASFTRRPHGIPESGAYSIPIYKEWPPRSYIDTSRSKHNPTGDKRVFHYVAVFWEGGSILRVSKNNPTYEGTGAFNHHTAYTENNYTLWASNYGSKIGGPFAQGDPVL